MGNRSKTINSYVGKQIKLLRESFNLTQEELGQKVNKGGSTVRMWELGKSEPDNDTLYLLADFFGVSADYLLGREDKHPPAKQEGVKIPDSLKPYQYAFFDGVDGLTDESMKDIMKYIEFVKAKEKNEKK